MSAEKAKRKNKSAANRSGNGGSILGTLTRTPLLMFVAGLVLGGCLVLAGVMLANRDGADTATTQTESDTQETSANEPSEYTTATTAAGDVEQTTQPRPDGPALTLETASVNLGKIPQNETIEHRIEFENTGTEPLAIFEVEAS